MPQLQRDTKSFFLVLDYIFILLIHILLSHSTSRARGTRALEFQATPSDVIGVAPSCQQDLSRYRKEVREAMEDSSAYYKCDDLKNISKERDIIKKDNYKLTR